VAAGSGGERLDEVAVRLDEAVARLSAGERTAIVLRFYQDMPFEEVAKALEITEEAAKKRVTRAVGRLRERLGVAGLSAGTLGVAAMQGVGQMPAGLS